MEVIFDPFDPTHYLDPHPRLARLRAQCPVSEPNSWSVVVTRDDDIRLALRNTHAFSSTGDLIVSESEEDPPSVFELDPPEHTRLRRLQTHMTYSAISSAEAPLSRLANTIIAGFAHEHHGDLMALYANPFPLLAVMQLLGVPEDIHEDFYRCAVEVKTNLPYAFKRLPSWKHLKALIQQMVTQQRTGQAPANMLTHLVRARHHEEQLTDEDIRMAIFQLTSGGSNATSLLIGNVVYRLLEHPELWEQLLADHSLIPLAIEESLRYDPPAPWVMRLCQEETVIQGKHIAPGKRVILSLNSGNRSENVWPEPDTFSLNHSQNSRTHLGFGYGPHFCLGAPLARLIGKIGLETLLTQLPSLRLPPGSHFEGMQAAMLHGPMRLEVQWQPVP